MSELEELPDPKAAKRKKERGVRDRKKGEKGSGRNGSLPEDQDLLGETDRFPVEILPESRTLEDGMGGAAGFLTARRLQRILKKCQVHPLLWSTPDATADDRIEKMLGRSVKADSARSVRKWQADFSSWTAEKRFEGLSQQNRIDAFDMLAVGWLLGQSGAGRKPDGKKPAAPAEWQQLLLNGLWISADGFDELPHDDLLTWIWTQVELPLVLAAALEESHPAGASLLHRGARRLEEWFELTVDAEGCLPGRHAALVGPITLSVVRSATLLQQLGTRLSPRAENQLDWMVRQLMLGVGRDRSMLFSGNRLARDPGLARALLALSHEPRDHRLIRRQLGMRPQGGKKLPVPCHYSESQGIGVFRTGWKNGDCRIGVACNGPEMRIEVVGKPVLLDGPLSASWSLNGRPLDFEEASWTLNCWHEDSEVQYLELELRHEGGQRFQRHLVLLPEDRLLLIGDVLLGTTAARIDYRLNLPAARGIVLQQETDTREIYLKSGSIQSLVLPITLGEWQRDHTENAFSVMENTLQLDQSCVGQNLFAALAVDLCPKRSQRPRTWRQLTVGESLKVVSRDLAVAQRFQIGREQWVVYRNLAEVGNRTFLGCNVHSDFYLGRFDKDGNHRVLIMIEN